MKGKAVSASAFCSQFTTTVGLATPTYLSACKSASAVSSACTCLSTAAVNKRGIVVVSYSPPDFTYVNAGPSDTTTLTAGPVATTTLDAVPSETM
jgi:hypothetical protein